MVLIGTATNIYIPELPRAGTGPNRLRGLRLLHTHLENGGLSQEDLMDMLFLRLDAAIALTVTEPGGPARFQVGWLEKSGDPPYHTSDLIPWHDTEWDFNTIISDYEKNTPDSGLSADKDKNAILVSVSSQPHSIQERNLAELAELAATAGLNVAGTLIQRASAPKPGFILGKGKLAELEIQALNTNADLLVFDGELAPAQLHNLADITERKVLDRTQLILDIFAQHAITRAGKLQVELAQLAYSQPRLAGKHKALDRLMGGIGGRGPGESRLETDRRRIRERMGQLRRELEKMRRQRNYARQHRQKNQIPVAALVGYTNAGKSSLLNKLTSSEILAADKLFATLDTSTRRIRFPEAREFTISDTVGFIRNLPRELMEAFRATLEELGNADLLIHVADAASPELERQMDSVNAILEELGLHEKKCILVLNKTDLLKPEAIQDLSETWPGVIPVSAKSGRGLDKLLLRIEQCIFMERLEKDAS